MWKTLFELYKDACFLGVTGYLAFLAGFGIYAFWRLAIKGDD